MNALAPRGRVGKHLINRFRDAIALIGVIQPADRHGGELR
jgi:hypothetical protein